MEISVLLSDQLILAELGERILRIRLQKNLRQIDLANEAGVSRSTVARLESGEVATQLVSLLRVCRVLGVLERFETLLPEAKVGPIEAMKFEKSGRQRAMSPARRARETSARSAGKPWVWGDGRTAGHNEKLEHESERRERP
jgi:transcriptional regulator with XRE-family HTH domain